MVFGDYGSYGAYGGSPYGPVEGSSFLPPYYHPGMAQGGPSQDEFIGISKKKKKTGLEGFLKGIYNGAVNTVKGIFSVQGIAMTATTAGLVWATGGAALLPLAALGTGIGGFQILKGIAKGDAEGVGEGVFTTGASLLGLKFTPKTANLGGKSYTLTGEGEKLGLIGRFKALWGGTKYKAADGETLNVWQMGAAKFQSRFQPSAAAGGFAGLEAKLNPTNWTSRKDVENLPTLKMGRKEFENAYAKAREEVQSGLQKVENIQIPNIKDVEALHKAQLNLSRLESQSIFPEQKSINQFLKADDNYLGEIRSLKVKKSVKKYYSDAAEIQDLDNQIKSY